MKNTYAVIEGDRYICGTAKIATARKHRDGIAGRRIIKLDTAAPAIQLRAFRGDPFTIHGTEVR